MSKHASAFREKYGPCALVTGASSGIGRAFAAELAKLGFELVLVARNEPELQRVSRDARAAGSPAATVLALDLGDPTAMESLEGACADKPIGLVVAAAGFGTAGRFMDLSIQDERNELEVNCASVLALAHYFARAFAKRGGGGLILMGSLLGYQGTPLASNYAATKAYIQTLSEGLHRELKPYNIDVISSAPGPVNSGFADRADMRMSLAMGPDIVAKETLAKLGRAATATPGTISKLLTYSLVPLPRILRTRIMELIMRNMTAHQQHS